MRDNTGQHRNWKMRIQIVLRFFGKGVGVLWFKTSNVKFCMITFNQKFWSIPRFLWVTLIDQRSIAIQSWWEKRVEVYSPRWPSYDLLHWMVGFFYKPLLSHSVDARHNARFFSKLKISQSWKKVRVRFFAVTANVLWTPPPHEHFVNDSDDDDGGVKSERDSLIYNQSRLIAAQLDDLCCWYLNFCFDHLYFPDNREL